MNDDQEVEGSIPTGLATFFVKMDHEIFFTVILSSPLIQEGSGKRMCTILVNCLEELNLASKSVVRQTDHAQHNPTGLTGP